LSGAKKEDAEDILQETFIKVYRNLNEFDKGLKFSSWIYRIAHNETITYLRKSNSRPEIINSETNQIILDLLSADLSIEQEIDNKYLAEKIEKTINALDGKYRDVIILRYLEDKDYKDISDILKKPPGTVATLLKRAKGQLKKEILKNNINL
jgi:RNA polymerase sigma-70 factor (ECF subfamily)